MWHRAFYAHSKETSDTDVISRFQGDDFTRPGRLDAEFLLGYHCQRAALRWGDSKGEAKEESSQEPQLV